VPDFFHDLHLDRVVEAITAGRQEYDLVPFFHENLTDPDAVAYRQEVMRDMEGGALRNAVSSFAERMRTQHRWSGLATRLRYPLERQRWHLASVDMYAEAVQGLSGDIATLDLASRGLRAFRAHLAAHAHSASFRTLVDEAREVAEALGAIRYCTLVRDARVTVLRYDGESDYSAAVEETFRKFREGAAKDHRSRFGERLDLNHVEAQILDRVALLYPAPFEALSLFCERHADFVDPAIVRFDREIQFYGAFLDWVGRFRSAGLPFCYPRIADPREGVFARGSFDVALADRLLRDKAAVVCNDFLLQGPERVLVVTGPNQGGKTTFARMFGQLHWLAGLGCPVPGREAQVPLHDHLFVHFEREEDIATLRGRLEDDLVRIRGILDRASPQSVLVLNEVFSSTTLEDAVFLGREVLARVARLGAPCVCVTFLDELSALGEETVSMVAGVDPRDPTVRTFRIERRPADGLAHALAIAERHRVTYRRLKERLRT
jgi:hypothetical protein